RGVGDAQVAGVDEAQVVEVAVPLGVELVFFGQALVSKGRARVREAAAVEELAGLVDGAVGVVVDAVGPPHRAIERAHVRDLQERLVANVDDRGEVDLVVAAVAVGAREREIRVDVGDSLMAREARAAEWRLSLDDLLAAADPEQKTKDDTER
ncbi:MAG: hypothetical protein ACK559_14810, partial [bacterium]